MPEVRDVAEMEATLPMVLELRMPKEPEAREPSSVSTTVRGLLGVIVPIPRSPEESTAPNPALLFCHSNKFAV